MPTLTTAGLLAEARTLYRPVTPEQAARAVADGGLIVDIRSEGQRARDGLVPGARYVPRNVLEWRAEPGGAHRDPALEVAGALVLMCAEGYQSSLAAATLVRMGVARATDMIGGFDAWRAAGLPVEGASGAGAHWEAVHARRGAEGVSWYEATPAVSMDLIRGLGPAPGDPVIDVGGGASTLVDHLLADGLVDVTVLDIAGAALGLARRRLGERAHAVRWVHADLLSWEPGRRYAIWHDRAVFHFLAGAAGRRRYAELLEGALAPGGHAVIGSFAPSGPDRCSGLPVMRHDAASLAAEAGPRLRLVASREATHTTPGGDAQPFTWVVLRAPGG